MDLKLCFAILDENSSLRCVPIWSSSPFVDVDGFCMIFVDSNRNCATLCGCRFLPIIFICFLYLLWILCFSMNSDVLLRISFASSVFIDRRDSKAGGMSEAIQSTWNLDNADEDDMDDDGDGDDDDDDDNDDESHDGDDFRAVACSYMSPHS